MQRRAYARNFSAFLARFVFLLLLSCAGMRAQELGNIVGQIRLPNGNFPEPILVTLQTRGSTLNSVYCDQEGRFAFYNLVSNPYHVVIEAEGYQPFHQIVTVNPTITQTTLVHIVLVPMANSKAEGPPALPSGGNPYAVNIANYAKEFPAEAVKEFEAGVKSDKLGKLDQAILHYRKAIRIAPDFYPARNNLGVRYLSKGDFEAAENELRQAIKLNPNDAQAYFNLGNVLYVTKRYRDAAGILQEGLHKQPDSALGLHLLGAVQIRLGTLDEAERSLRAAIALDGKMSKTRLELANLYLLQHRQADAARELKSFVEQFPHDPMLAKVKEVLKKLDGPNTPPR